MKKVWTDSDIKFIKKNYPTKGSSWCAKKLGMSKAAVQSKASVLKLRRTNFYMPVEHKNFIKKNLHRSNKEIAIELKIKEHSVRNFIHLHKLRQANWDHYSEEETQYIKDNYISLSYTEIGKVLGRSKDSIKARCEHLNLKRTEKQSKAIQKRSCSKSYFKKGNLPGNTLYDGAITERTDSGGITYKYIRISKAEWIQLHIYNWEKKYGPVPSNMILRCKDGNQLNCEPSNWELIDRATNLELNSGSKTLEDNYIIAKLSHRNPELKKIVSQFPELIELKRQQLKLRRAINECTD
jgi:hypothetical protein